jgi:hypothetical protein
MNVLSVLKNTGLFEEFQASSFCHSFKSIIVMKNSVVHWGSDIDMGNAKSLIKTCPKATYKSVCKGSFPKFRLLYLFGLFPLSQQTKHKDSEMKKTSFSLKLK